ncbi:MAG TPA: DUF512 domain-containing protein [Gemmatimonadaceae bacterium]|nr:DUF512 domain-containing protein [Gemmatimonadaceae bacterium]
MVRIARIHAGSIAGSLGLVAGTELVAVNGRALDDFLDWEFLSADDALEIEATLPSGERVILDVERPEHEPFGLELEPPAVRRCANRCEFCFVEGLPKGLRRALYIRDDDYRLSFAYGNFATLSNLKDKDVARILAYRLSPLYVSVHATDWEARKRLLNNPRVPDVLRQLASLASGGIQFHCQMVIVPGVNDGAVLERSLTDLWALGDAALTVAIVPVGLTQFSHLYTGQPMDAADAGRLLETAERWGERSRAARGETWVMGSDELYLLAGRDLPGPEFYGDFAQVENGVGAVAALRERVAEGLTRLPRLDGRRVGVVTGTAMAPLMPPLLERLSLTTGAHFELMAIPNSLFGPTTTTAGLLVGADIRRALEGRTDLDLALIPAETINDDGLFLDDERFDALRDALTMPVRASYDFVDVLAGEPFGVGVAAQGAA